MESRALTYTMCGSEGVHEHNKKMRVVQNSYLPNSVARACMSRSRRMLFSPSSVPRACLSTSRRILAVQTSYVHHPYDQGMPEHTKNHACCPDRLATSTVARACMSTSRKCLPSRSLSYLICAEGLPEHIKESACYPDLLPTSGVQPGHA